MRRDREPCHFSFTFTKETPVGGSIQAQFLEATSREEIPVGATDIRPLHEGGELLAGTGVVHSHVNNGNRKSPFDEHQFVETASKEPLQSAAEGALMSLINRVVPS